VRKLSWHIPRMVGVNVAKRTFCSRFFRYAYPIPHTTRPPRRDEEDGKNYFFVSQVRKLSWFFTCIRYTTIDVKVYFVVHCYVL
jgi:hypothetical protein